MIGMRIGCDEPGCGRHFEIPAHELMPMPSVLFSTNEVGLIFAGRATFPEGWAVGEEHPGQVRVLCVTHAPAQMGRAA
jgi:hypothetical protein